MWSHNPSEIGPSAYEVDELYALYMKVAQRTSRGIDSVMPAGPTRQYFQNLHRPLPKEHFEARLFDLYADESRYSRVATLLRESAADLTNEF